MLRLSTVLVLCACPAGRVAGLDLKHGSTEATAARRDATKWWPFASQSQAVPAAKATVEGAVSIESAKDAVLMSAAFGRKTAALCRDAPDDERRRCRQLAGQRIFCTLLKRHEKRYRGMSGAAQEKAKCMDVNIMEDAAEAAGDEKLQQEAAEA
mmetsp:Transcript_6648/g.12377  ORF Transcript_6648/g.12377 Transcript_6648/m.12377 type:complete len:154 (+) Transcript_6648:85-546(+)